MPVMRQRLNNFRKLGTCATIRKKMHLKMSILRRNLQVLTSTILQQEEGEGVMEFLRRTKTQRTTARQAVLEEMVRLKVDRPDHPIFKDLPSRLEFCKTEEESELHSQRAALVLKERYSHVPFHAERAKKDSNY